MSVDAEQTDHLPVVGPDWATEAEARVLDAAVRLAADQAWSQALVIRAAKAAGLGAADAALLLPGGPRDLAALLARRHDAACAQALSGVDPATLKVRERIRLGVQARVDAAMADEAAVRRAAFFMARPANAGLALSLTWASADALWRWAGDTSTDENHYSKRAIVSAVLASTLAMRLAAGRERADRHLDRRIDNVMAFETWKAGLPRAADALASGAALLGRLRYGRRDGASVDPPAMRAAQEDRRQSP